MSIVIFLFLIALVLAIALAAGKAKIDSLDRDAESKVDRYQDVVNPEMGWFESLFARKRFEGQAKAQEAANEASTAIIEGSELNERAEESREIRKATNKVALTTLESTQVELETRNELMRLAQRQGLDITIYLQVASHRELKQIDLEAREIEYKQDQEQISRVQQEKLELIDRATHRLYSMYRERKELETSNDPAKDDILAQLNYNISIAERLIRGEQDRYLEDALGAEGQRNIPEADSTGRLELTKGESPEPERKRGRGRPRKNPADNGG
jgi:hypothetical protein